MIKRLKKLNRTQKLILAGAVALLAAVIVILSLRGGGRHDITGENLLKDADFAQYAADGSGAWYEDAYVMRSSYTDFDFDKDEDGGTVAHIRNKLANDARYAQIVAVRPDSLYCLEGDIKAQCRDGLGANLSVEGPYVFSESLYDVSEWTHIKLYGRTSESQTSVTVFVRLGGYSGEAQGEAWFRNIRLTEVDQVEEGYVARNWFTAHSAATLNEKDEGSSSPVPHALLILLAAIVYLAMILYTVRLADRKSPLRYGRWIAAAIFCAALVLRLILAVSVHGYDVDVNDFRVWAESVVSSGTGAFYSQGFCDYPPGYIMVLGIVGLLGKLMGTGVTELMIKLPPIACDLLSAFFILLTAFPREKGGRRQWTSFALWCAVLCLFNPVTLLTSACWGQSDSVMMLFLTLTVIFAMRGRWAFAIPFYGLAVLMKPQALMFGPIGLIALVVDIKRPHEYKDWLGFMIWQFLIGFFSMCAIILGTVLLFNGGRSPVWIFELYGKTMHSYAYATVNACNFYFLCGLNWENVVNTAPRWFGLAACMVLIVPSALCAFLRREKKEPVFYMSLTVAAAGAVLALVGVIFPLSYQVYSTVFTVIAIALTLVGCFLSGELKHLPLYGGILITLLFALSGMMHERYLFPAAILFFMAWLLEKDDRILICLALVSIGAFMNTACVLSRNVRVGGSSGHLSAPLFAINSDMSLLEYLSAVMNVAAASFSAYTGLLFAARDHAVMALTSLQKKTPTEAKDDSAPEAPRLSGHEHLIREELGGGRSIRPERNDLIIMAVITALYAVLAFWHLGSTVSPQNGHEFQAYYEETDSAAQTGDIDPEPRLVTEQVTFDLGQHHDAFRMLYMGSVHEYDCDFTVQTSDDNITWGPAYHCDMDIGNLFQWMYVRSYQGRDNRSLSGRYVRISTEQAGLTLLEVLFRDSEGNTLSVENVTSTFDGNVEALIDEQATLEGEPSWYNSMYFDEIYHARTAYEHMVGMHPYETTHPPLGKVLMSICVMVLGMTPFGWRFAGTMAGVLMLPGIYLIARLLFKKRRFAVMCTLMMALDTMHYTQTRIATIDSFVTLFIIWSYYFMFAWFYTDFFGKPLKSSLIPLGLSGLFMGLSVASKWTGCYAGVGLAIIFFYGVFRRIRVILIAGKSGKKADNKLKAAKKNGLKRLLLTIGSCFIFFIAVPLLIYYLSYIPYFAPTGGVSAAKIIRAAEGMLAYHSTPGLGMDHAFYSPWYEWPLSLKPMYYAADSYEPAGYAASILSFGNPAVWWVGALAVLLTIFALLYKQIPGSLNGYRTGPAQLLAPRDERDTRPFLLVISFAAQYLPWVLVPRGTYIYHYFPSIPFVILCTGLIAEYLYGFVLSRITADGAVQERTGRADRIMLILLIVYLMIVLALFIALFPYASGITVRTGWLDAVNWFGNLYY